MTVCRQLKPIPVGLCFGGHSMVTTYLCDHSMTRVWYVLYFSDLSIGNVVVWELVVEGISVVSFYLEKGPDDEAGLTDDAELPRCKWWWWCVWRWHVKVESDAIWWCFRGNVVWRYIADAMEWWKDFEIAERGGLHSWDSKFWVRNVGERQTHFIWIGMRLTAARV